MNVTAAAPVMRALYESTMLKGMRLAALANSIHHDQLFNLWVPKGGLKRINFGESKKRMEKYDKFTSIFWLGLGLVIIYGACKIGLGRLSNPGGGLFVLVLGIFLSCLALIIFISSRTRKLKDTDYDISLWVGLKWQYPIYILTALFIYTLITPKVGYIPATTFLMLFLFALFEHHKWKLAISEAILAGLLSYLVFGPWLQVRLPRGVLEVLFGF